MKQFIRNFLAKRLRKKIITKLLESYNPEFDTPKGLISSARDIVNFIKGE